MKGRTKQALRQIRIRATALLIICAMAVTSTSTFAGMDVFAESATSGTCGDNLTWSLDTATGVLTISGDGDMVDYWGHGSTPWYDYESAIKEVKFDGNITSIGEYAFSGCSSLPSITIPDSVTSIGAVAFSDCSSLTSVTIPDSVTSISIFAFSDCSSLPSITIPDSVTLIGDWAFEYCSSLTSVTIGNSVISIGSYAFWSCSSLTNVTIGNSVTSIGYAAFLGCSSLPSITIPDSVTSIGNCAFYNCSSLTSISVADNNKNYASKDGVLFNKDFSTLICYPGGKIGDYIIPDGVTSIGDGAFYYCDSLKRITIPDSVTSIGYSAFEYCSGLTNITIPDSVTSIGYWAFEYCRGLTSITIPDSVTSIEIYAFKGCYNLTSVTIGNSVTSIGDSAFKYCYDLPSITIPNSVTSIGNDAFSSCSSLTSITIPDSVTSIARYAFSGCSSLTDVYYAGSEEDWSRISIYDGNECLTNATIHYNSGNDGNTSYADQIQKKFIDEHVSFIEQKEFDSYVNYRSIQDSIIGNDDFESARKSYKAWETAMLQIFDNPFDVVLADYILDSDIQNALQEVGSVELKNTQTKIITDVIQLIDEKAELTDDDKLKITSLFEKKDYSDKETYKMLQTYLEGVDEETLQNMLAGYDKANLVVGILGDGLTIVEGVGNTIQYCSVLNAYLASSDYLKQMLSDLKEQCEKGQLPNTAHDPELIVKAIDKYLNATEENAGNYIAKKAVGEGALAIIDIFGELFVSRIKDFLVKSISKNVSASVLTQVNGFIAGAKIGYSIGTTICNSLLNLSNSADAYSTFYASAEMAAYLKVVLNNAKDKFYENQTYENAMMFCEYYRMYQKLQINIANYGIDYCNKVDTSWFSRLFNKQSMMALSGQFSVRKVYWESYSCPLLEDIGVEVDTSVKFITVACPVDVNITDSNGNTVVDIKNGEVIQQGDRAEALVNDNIKYIALLNNDDYKINITATDNGTMDYYVTDLDNNLNVKSTTAYSGIQLTNNKQYSGNLEQSPDNANVDYQLTTNGETVNCDSITYNADSYVDIAAITVDKDKIELNEGDTIKLSAEISPANATVKTVSWTSSDENVVTVDEYGNVKAVSSGTAVIHCYGIFSETMTSVSVTVKDTTAKVGDVNGDGEVNGKDSTLLMQYLAEWDVDIDKDAADVNGDGEVNGKDSTLLMQYLAEWDVTLG